jgi:3-hydroxyacyl-[acyl-carrier-protein] dehydratase
MLLNSFFFIERIEYINGVVRASLRLEKEHAIFKGHFPNLPIVPGVCMMQLVKEVLENLEGKRMQIEEAPNLKFLSILNPNENGLVESLISIDERLGDNWVKINATINAGSVIFFKMKATLKSL